MTPGQLGLLLRQHNRTQGPPAHSDTTKPAAAPKAGGAADLARFAAIPLA